MEILRYINVSVDLVGILVIFVIISCLSTGDNKENKPNKLFIGGLFTCVLYMLCEGIAWWLKGNPDFIWLLKIANDGVYCAGYLILIAFTIYLLNYLAERGVHFQRVMWIIPLPSPTTQT